MCDLAINPQRACVVRVTVVVSVCLLSRISSLELLFVGKMLPHTQWSKICGIFSETAPLPRLRAPFLGWPYLQLAIFPADNTHAHCAYASSPRFAMGAPCHKLSLHSSLGLESSN